MDILREEECENDRGRPHIQCQWDHVECNAIPIRKREDKDIFLRAKMYLRRYLPGTRSKRVKNHHCPIEKERTSNGAAE